MPLFFFVAGYFLKERPLKEEFSLCIKRLILPYVFVAFCATFIAMCIDLAHYTWADGSYTQGKIISYLLGYNGQINPSWIPGGGNGMLWFLLAMFWARMITLFFLKKIKSNYLVGLLTFLLAVVGVFIIRLFPIPFCIPQGLCAVGFVFVGYLMKKNGVLESSTSTKVFPFLAILWLGSVGFRGVAMFKCSFPMGYVFGLLGALGAFWALHTIVKKLYNSESFLWRSMLFWGKYSIVFYCVHAIDKTFFNWKAIAVLHHVPLEYFGLFQPIARLSFAFLFAIVLLEIKPIREQIFQIKGR